MMNKQIVMLMIIACCFLCSCGSNEKPEPVVLDFSNTDYIGPVDTGELKTCVGELISVNQNGSTVVVKTKIETSLTNEMTINQNYIIVGDLIKEHGFNSCDKLEYWAIMDLGMEVKEISFTLDKNVIDMIYNDKIAYGDIGPYTTDLWIAPNLQ